MSETLKVLLVEDDQDQAELIRRSLEKFDERFNVEIIDSGESCLEKISSQKYEAIILDYQLPVYDGLEILKRIKNRGIHVPIVVVSGQGNEKVAVEALKNGAYDYIIKDSTYFSVLPKVVQQTIEKHHLELKLRESERKYQNIFEKANDALFIIDPKDFTILEANYMASTLSQYSREELQARQFMELYPDGQKALAKQLIKKTLCDGHNQDDSLSIQTKTGDLIPVDINASVIYHENIHYVLCIVRNIAEKKQLQSLILNSKKRLQSLFDGITDMIYQVNRDYEIVMVNKKMAELCHELPEKLVGQKCYQAYFKCGEICEQCPAKLTFENSRPQYFEKVLGEEIFEVTSFPIYSDRGEIEDVVIYLKNVTEKKKLEKSLIQSEKLATIGLLSSGIAHELRNPLNIIETARFYLQEFIQDHRPEVQTKLDIIHKNVKRASSIINNLLEFSRQSDDRHEKINLKKLIESTIALIGKELSAKNIEFSLIGKEDHTAYFSLDSLKQVLLNILINAIQAMPEGGKLTIEVENKVPGWV
ncbi:MAG: response regulator, partial [Calditrichaeota bacterium]